MLSYQPASEQAPPAWRHACKGRTHTLLTVPPTMAPQIAEGSIIKITSCVTAPSSGQMAVSGVLSSATAGFRVQVLGITHPVDEPGITLGMALAGVEGKIGQSASKDSEIAKGHSDLDGEACTEHTCLSMLPGTAWVQQYRGRARRPPARKWAQEALPLLILQTHCSVTLAESRARAFTKCGKFLRPP